jgi:hypothetical protein
MVHGVAQNVHQVKNLNNYKTISENFARAKKIAGSVKQIICLYYQILKNFTLFSFSSWPLNGNLLTKRPTERNRSCFGEQFVSLSG